MSAIEVNKILDYEQLSVGGAVVPLTSSVYSPLLLQYPTSYDRIAAYILAEGDIRFTVGDDPTASVGFPLSPGMLLIVPQENISSFKMIAKAGTVTVNVLYVDVG